jgi:riboflavin synthase alpha subunit
MMRVIIPRAKVCRNVPMGISEVDTITAVVLAAESNRIRVRIERPGRLGAELDGHVVKAGMELTDYVDRWMVCR